MWYAASYAPSMANITSRTNYVRVNHHLSRLNKISIRSRLNDISKKTWLQNHAVSFLLDHHKWKIAIAANLNLNVTIDITDIKGLF